MPTVLMRPSISLVLGCEGKIHTQMFVEIIENLNLREIIFASAICSDIAFNFNNFLHYQVKGM